MISSKLEEISVDKISRNPDNPRLIFRQEDMDKLLNSIKEVGIQVPITVYKEGSSFVLIDGERRWICAGKLNMKTLPAIMVPKPTRLENILLMFNIHNVREQWELFPTALKLQEVLNLLKKAGRTPTISELATMTGLTLSTVRRCIQLLELPKKYREMLLQELEKPKAEQKISEDFFIEMSKALNSIERHVPIVFSHIPRGVFIDKFVEKYLSEKITNITKFRDISRIARGERTGISQNTIIQCLEKLAKDKDYTLEKAYEDSVATAYMERELKKELERISLELSQFKKREVTDELKQQLIHLKKIIEKLLGD